MTLGEKILSLFIETTPAEERTESPMVGLWINNKTSNRYWVERVAINATNAQNGHQMAIYHRTGDDTPAEEHGVRYVRELEEFKQKFTRAT